MKRKVDNETQEEILSNQIPEFTNDVENANNDSMVGKKIDSKFMGVFGGNSISKDELNEMNKISEKKGMTKLGESIFENEHRNGWIAIDRKLLGERNKFYPEDWVFMVRPATVEAIRNWSMIDENNGNTIDDVFNEILKYCLSIKTAFGPKPWQAINNWDRFFFVLLIREYTFVKGESNVEFFEDCENCNTPVKFNLTSQSLMYDIPDESVMEYYDSEMRCWNIEPADFGVQSENPITFYLPTVEKDANIKSWLINEYHENDKRKFDPVFIKFLPWMVPNISKEYTVAKTQIRKAEMVFKSWNADMFSFLDDVLKNISVTPLTTIKAYCNSCGSEAVTRLRFPNGVSALFNVVDRHKKFGTK